MPLTMETILTATKQIPSPPKVLVRLLSLVNDPDHDLRGLSAIVELDGGLSADVLRIANSAAYRRSGREVQAVWDAVGRLGETALVQLVLERGLPMMRDDVDGYDLHDDALWHRSLRAAIAAQHLATKANVPKGMAYAAGLLLDIGKLVLGQFIADNGGAAAFLEPTTFDQAERALLGADHAAVGAAAARLWGLPEPIVTAIRYHHHPHKAKQHQQLCQVMHVADCVAMMCTGAEGLDGMRYALRPEALTQCGLDEHGLYRMMLKVEAEVAQAEALLAG